MDGEKREKKLLKNRGISRKKKIKAVVSLELKFVRSVRSGLLILSFSLFSES